MTKVVKETFVERMGLIYVESKIPQAKQKFKGWFWAYPEKRFYRWSDLPFTEK
tara:strand:- start:2106 stop:2264 length:159 start_codon:yes stop_codon:yes gene_type:complete